MPKKKISALLLALALTCANFANIERAEAQGVTRINQPASNQWTQGAQRGGQKGKQKRMMLMPGDIAKENVQKVTSEIRWHSNLNSAMGQAHRQHKMILWVHLVGNLSGAT